MKQIDNFLMNCEHFNHYETEEAYTNDLRKYIMYSWNMHVNDASKVIDEHPEETYNAYRTDLPIADLAQEIVEGFPSEEEAEGVFKDTFQEDPEILALIDDLFAHEKAKKKPKKPGSSARLKSKINKIYPFDYSVHMRDLPATWIDPCDKTERKIRCVSDGVKERQWLDSDQTFIEDYDIDDITYYLDDVLEDGGLTVGKEYTLIKADVDFDVEMGLVWLKEIESVNGIPAFLFEELKPVDVENRVQNWDARFKDDGDAF